MIKGYFKWFIGTYAYSDVKEFLLSLFPSYKYQLHNLTLILSVFSALINMFFGIGPIIAFAMIVAILAETWTGLKASFIRKEKYSSHKFSRCVIKVAVWYTLLFITNSFAVDFGARDGVFSYVTSLFFDFIRVMILSFFAIEYVTSILENLAVIDGKPKDALISVISEYWSSLISKMRKS